MSGGGFTYQPQGPWYVPTNPTTPIPTPSPPVLDVLTDPLPTYEGTTVTHHLASAVPVALNVSSAIKWVQIIEHSLHGNESPYIDHLIIEEKYGPNAWKSEVYGPIPEYIPMRGQIHVFDLTFDEAGPGNASEVVYILRFWTVGPR